MKTATPIDELTRVERGPEAWRLALAAHEALIAQLERLQPAEWGRPTVCEPWTVADVVRHVLGAAVGQASVPKGIRQQLRARRHAGEFDGSMLDAWTGLHVLDRAELPPQELLARLRVVAPRAVTGRRRFPALLGAIPIPVPEVGSLAPGTPTRTSLGELNTITYTRDTWLHRIDIARATDRPVQLDPAVDGRIVQDIAIEWAQRHAQPFHLTLDGPAGGVYARGHDGARTQMDAIEFAWILSGRADPDPAVPGADLLRTRVLF